MTLQSMTPRIIRLEDLNQMEHDAFVDALGWIFEHSPWIADRVWHRRPFVTVDVLHREMSLQVEQASIKDQLALIQAHPDLGERTKMSDASAGEQSGAGLAKLSSSEYARLQKLNTAYRERFGFPFIFAVKGSGKREILAALEQRLQSDKESEFAIALDQVFRIARFRLADMLEGA